MKKAFQSIPGHPLLQTVNKYWSKGKPQIEKGYKENN